MKKALFCLFVLFACMGIFAQNQHTVVVTPFDLVGNGISREEVDVIYELFITELSNISGIRVVDRNSFDIITAQMQFQISDWSDNNKIAEFGKALNANAIIRGQCMTLGGRIVISARIIDVNTTESLSGAPLQLNSLDEIFEKLTDFVANVVKNLPKPVYKIGDIGPGGGLIFFTEGGHYKECRIDLDKANWDDADRTVRNFRGGNFSNWHLPTINEAPFINRNLVTTNQGTSIDSSFWIGERYISPGDRERYYRCGVDGFSEWWRYQTVLAIRDFNQ